MNIMFTVTNVLNYNIICITIYKFLDRNKDYFSFAIIWVVSVMTDKLVNHIGS